MVSRYVSVDLERERETEQEMREWVSGYWLGEKEGGRPKEREIKWERENEKIKKKLSMQVPPKF